MAKLSFKLCCFNIFEDNKFLLRFENNNSLFKIVGAHAGYRLAAGAGACSRKVSLPWIGKSDGRPTVDNLYPSQYRFSYGNRPGYSSFDGFSYESYTNYDIGYLFI